MSALVLSYALLEQARIFFEDCGTTGCEGTAMIARSETSAATHLVIPDQRANPAPYCWVEVTERGKLDLAVALGPDDLYAARIHSHPMDAFHSPTDDANPALIHDGAISIVVPYFGLGLRRGLDACTVYVLGRKVWREIPVSDRTDIVVVR